MRKTLFLVLTFITLLLVPRISAQDLIDFTDFKITPDIVHTATLLDGVKADFCEVDLGVSAHELLTKDISDENFTLPDNIKSSPCKGESKDVIIANISVEFTKPVQNQESLGFLFLLFRDHLFQQNGQGSSYTYYSGHPDDLSYNYFNGGEEGNSPPFGNPKWLKYERDSNFIEMDSNNEKGYKTNPDTGFFLHFDENGKRENFLFIFEGKIYKLVHAEKKTYNTLLIDYSQTASPSGESSSSATPD